MLKISVFYTHHLLIMIHALELMFWMNVWVKSNEGGWQIVMNWSILRSACRYNPPKMKNFNVQPYLFCVFQIVNLKSRHGRATFEHSRATYSVNKFVKQARPCHFRAWPCHLIVSIIQIISTFQAMRTLQVLSVGEEKSKFWIHLNREDLFPFIFLFLFLILCFAF